MATLQMLINLFPAETGGVQAAAAVALVTAAAVIGCAAIVSWRRAARRRLATEHALQHGLSLNSAAFFADVFQRESTPAAESLLTAPDLLTKRLVLAIAKQAGQQAALRFAAIAAQLLDELDLRVPAFPGAPRPCEPLLLSDPTEPEGPGITVFVGAADERNIIVVSPSSCPWPLRHGLLAMPQPLPRPGGQAAAQATSSNSNSGGAGAAADVEDAMKDAPPRRLAFQVALLLRPMPPQHEWVLTHALVETITNRRAVARVPCRIETVTLPDSGDPLLLRQRLQREETVPLDELRGSRAWSQRLTVTVLDLSADGARLSLDQPLAKHQRLHLLLTRPDDTLLALPLGEVVDVKHDNDGRTIAGVRFIGVRMKERLCLADFVRVLAGPIGANAHRLPRGPGRQRGAGL